MKLTHWLLTFLAFPPAGYVAMETVGSIEGPLTGAAAGAVAGAIIGFGQWLALRNVGVGAGWIPATSAAMAAGAAVAAAITGAGTSLGELMVGGAIAGSAVGAAQALSAGRDRLSVVGWSIVTGACWTLGWAITTTAGVDVERGWAVFGASGAIVATALTGLALRHLLADGAPLRTSRTQPVVAAA